MSTTTPIDTANTLTLDGLCTATDCIPITVGASPLAKPVRALRCEGAGTLTVTTFAGNSRVLYFKDGETRFVGATHVTAASGPTVIEGLL